MKRQTVIRQPWYDDLTGPVNDVIAKLHAWKIEHGPDIHIELDLVDQDYGDGKKIECNITRLETDEEEKIREDKLAKRQVEYTIREHQQYLALKAKFER